MAVERDRASRPGLWISGIVALALAAYCLPQPGGAPGQTPLVVGGLWLGAVLLQAFASELPGLGPFSSAPALSMAAVLVGRGGAGMASLICLSALCVRSLLRPRRTVSEILAETLADAVPELLTLAVIAGGAGPVGCLLYVPLAWIWPQVMSWGAPPALRKGRRDALVGSYIALAALAIMSGSLDLAGHPEQLGPLLLVLAALQRFPRVATPARRPWSVRRGLVQKAPTRSPEQIMMEQLMGALAGCRTQWEGMDAILRVVAQVCPSRSQVLFLRQEGKLLPVRYHSPRGEQLDAYSLLDLPEPVVEAAFRSGTSLSFPPQPDTRPRLFADEQAGAALVVEREGVLYVGRERGALSEEELRLLELIAAQVMPTLRVLHSQECERMAVEQYHREHQRLEEELQRLQSLLEGTRQMVSTLDFGALDERLETMLRTSLPHDFGMILALHEGRLEPRHRWGLDLDPAAALAVAQTVLEHGLPLTLLGPSRLAPVVAGQTGLVAAPMQLEQGTTGVLLVGSVTTIFEREHQDLLWMIGCLAAISFSNAGLHQEVVEAQAQLVHAGKLAAIGQLAAGVAHELNTPLGAIRLNLDSLARQCKEAAPPVLRKLQLCQMATDQARDIVEKLLIYCRDDRSAYQPVDVNLVVRQTLDLVGAQLQRDRVSIDLQLHPVPQVLGHLIELRQVLTNLLMNARDAALSPEATAPDVRVRTSCQGDWVLVQVLDHGAGVPPELESRIFEPFFTTKPVGRGTGLGLSISYRIAINHGGALEVASPPGAGACFTLRLPVLKETAQVSHG